MFKNKLNETKSRKAKLSTQTMAVFAILIAAQFVISQFLTFQVWNIKISFSFIPVVIAARLYGAVGAAEVAGIGDIIGVIFRPVEKISEKQVNTAPVNAMRRIFAICPAPADSSENRLSEIP